MNEAPEGHVDKKQLAQLLHRGVRTIEMWMHQGLIPYYKSRKRVSFVYSEVQNAMQVFAHSQSSVHEKNNEKN